MNSRSLPGNAVSSDLWPMNRRAMFCGTVMAFVIPTVGNAAPGLVVDVDITEAPDLAVWGEQLKRRVAAWWSLINEALASPDFSPPQNVRLILTKSRPGSWGGPSEPTLIYINAAAVKAHPGQVNYVAYFLVHVAQSYHGVIKRWLFDGIADYVRYYVLFPQDPGRFFPPVGADYRKGGNMAAALLDWMERERGIGTIRKLNAAMRQGQDGETVLEQLAGVPIDEAWSMVLASLTEGSPAQTGKPA